MKNRIKHPRTAERRAYLTGEGKKRQEWGEQLVIVNKRGGSPCPHCLKWVGKILIDDVYSGGKPDGKHQLLSEAMAEGFLHPRCKDGFTTYFPGISSAPDPVTRSEVREAVKAEQEENRENYAQRQAEKYGRLAQYSLDPENRRRYQARAEEWGAQRAGDSSDADITSNAIEKEKEDAIIGSNTSVKFADGESSNRYFQQQSEQLVENTQAGIAFNYWSDSGSSSINRYLRGQINSIIPGELKRAQEDAETMRTWIGEQHLQDDIRVYRTMKKSTFNRETQNGVYRDKGFTATATIFEAVQGGVPEAESVWLEITVPAGKGRGVYINSVSEFKDAEYEYLIQAGSGFRITGSYLDEEGREIITAEMIP